MQVLLSREQSQALPLQNGSQMHTLQSQIPWPSRKDSLSTANPPSGDQLFILFCGEAATLTSAQLVSRAVAVEVVALAELAAVPLLGVVPLFALARAAHALSVAAADLRAVALAACAVHVLGGHVVAAAFALPPDASLVTPEGEVVRLN